MKNRKIINNQQQLLQKRQLLWEERNNHRTHVAGWEHTQTHIHWLGINRRIILSKWNSLNCRIRLFIFCRVSDVQHHVIRARRIPNQMISKCMWNNSPESSIGARVHSQCITVHPSILGPLLFYTTKYMYIYLVCAVLYLVWKACRAKWITHIRNRERSQITFTLYHQNDVFSSFYFVSYIIFYFLPVWILQFIFILLVFMNMISLSASWLPFYSDGIIIAVLSHSRCRELHSTKEGDQARENEYKKRAKTNRIFL